MRTLDELLKEAIIKDTAHSDKVAESIRITQELFRCFLDSDYESLIKVIDVFKSFLVRVEKELVPRIEGFLKYEDDEENTSMQVEIPKDCHCDGTINWGKMFESCAQNTLKVVYMLSGKVWVKDYDDFWEFPRKK